MFTGSKWFDSVQWFWLLTDLVQSYMTRIFYPFSGAV